MDTGAAYHYAFALSREKITALLNKIKEKVEKAQNGWRNVVAAAVTNGIPVPAISSGFPVRFSHDPAARQVSEGLYAFPGP